jgi:hypothetical protein
MGLAAGFNAFEAALAGSARRAEREGAFSIHVAYGIFVVW